mgnify:CR=1 FL=1
MQKNQRWLFLVKYDYDNEEVYIGMNALFYFMELYGLEVNTENKSISGKLEGKNINVSFQMMKLMS